MLTKVVAVTGGKGGVGKTQCAMNLALALSRKQEKVLLLDADFGLCNIDVLWGLKSVNNLSHVIAGQKSLQDVLMAAPENIDFIPSASGCLPLAHMSAFSQYALMQQFNQLDTCYDTLIVDTAAGIGVDVLQIMQAADIALVVITDEPTSLTDAYATIKVLKEQHAVKQFDVVCNRMSHWTHGQQVFARLAQVCDQFCPVTLNLAAVIPEDTYVKKAMSQRKTCLEAYPSGKAARAYRQLAEHIVKQAQQLDYVAPNLTQGNIRFFYPSELKPSSLSA